MIYSASRRTDLVAFYPDLICERVARSRKLEAIVFWTKDPRNLIRHPGLNLVLRRYPAVIQLTLTGLGGGWWEPDVPAPEALLSSLTELARLLPTGAIRWRFDPILPDGVVLPPGASSPQPVIDRYGAILELLRTCGIFPDEAVVSFPDAYPGVKARLAASGVAFPAVSRVRQIDILKALGAAGRIPLALCCEPALLRLPGVRQAHCIDGALFDRLYGTAFSALPNDAGQRAHCGCCRSTDIGRYDLLCRHNCRYCYACPASAFSRSASTEA